MYLLGKEMDNSDKINSVYSDRKVFTSSLIIKIYELQWTELPTPPKIIKI